MIESAFGGSRLIVYPSRTGEDDEQMRFALRLSRHYPVFHLDRLDTLENVLRENWLESICQTVPVLALEIDGAARIKDLLRIDLVTDGSVAISA